MSRIITLATTLYIFALTFQVQGQKMHGMKITPSAFVSSASPSIASNGPAPVDILHARTYAIASGYKSIPLNKRSPTVLHSSSTKDSSTHKGGKIQVKLLKDIPGIGQAGDFIVTAPAYFENKLRPSKSAIRVSPEEVAWEISQRKENEKQKMDHANEMKEKIENLALVIKMKAGPDGHLFGGVGFKNIMEEIKKKFPNGALDGKNVKILSIKDEANKDIGHDIKNIGDFKITISLLKEISAEFTLRISKLDT